MSWTEEDIAKVLTPLLLAYGSGILTLYAHRIEQQKKYTALYFKANGAKTHKQTYFCPVNRRNKARSKDLSEHGRPLI